MLLKINGKVAAKTLKGMNNKILACVNCNFFEEPPDFIKNEFNCYGMLDDVVKTGSIEGLKIQKSVLNWFVEEYKKNQEMETIIDCAS